MVDLRTRLSEDHPDIEVWAAGGVVTREHRGDLEVLLVHRPHHNDWSFPKGKMDEGETLGQTALREVEEETGYRCSRLDRLPAVSYNDAKGRRKLAVYWTMRIEDGAFVPNEEVDTLGWFPVEAARALLTYERDTDLLTAIPTVGTAT